MTREHVTVDDLVEFLNGERVRATYTTAAWAVRKPPQSLGKNLGPRSQRNSWVVSKTTGLPTGYDESLMAPGLGQSEIITSGEELLRRVVEWKEKNRKARHDELGGGH